MPDRFTTSTSRREGFRGKTLSLSRVFELLRPLLGAFALVVALPLWAGGHGRSRCADFACGLPHSGALTYLVIGRVTAVASSADSASLFHRMRTKGAWSSLPDSSDRFTNEIQTVVIDAGDRTLAVNMSRAEMNAAPLAIGDLVRYAPHHGAFEKPPEDPEAAAYWSVDGCVAILCRETDAACARLYVTGAFDHVSGVQLSQDPARALASGHTIDIDSLLPKDRSTR